MTVVSMPVRAFFAMELACLLIARLFRIAGQGLGARFKSWQAVVVILRLLSDQSADLFEAAQHTLFNSSSRIRR